MPTDLRNASQENLLSPPCGEQGASVMIFLSQEKWSLINRFYFPR